MNTDQASSAADRGSELSEGLGPLPEPAGDLRDTNYVPGYTAEQVLAYGAQERAAERERLAAACWERRGHFASDAAARAFAELVRDGLA